MDSRNAGGRRGTPAPEGFRFAATSAGIRRRGGRDFGLILADRPCVYAAAYTRNVAKAAPVLWDLTRVDKARVQAVLANSGNASAGTGAGGLKDCARIAAAAARVLGVPERRIFLASTGKIGSRLPLDRMLRALPILKAEADPRSVDRFSRAILTTDTRPKLELRTVRCGGRSAGLLGVAKGAGMIAPRLATVPHATMLAFVMTDALVEQPELRRALAQAVDRSFNRITVDGDMSTNDTVLVLASGRVALDRAAAARFNDALEVVLVSLAKQIVADGEGVTRCFTVAVEGARSGEDAEILARAVAQSLLVKTAIHGGDPNWGRMLAALGSALIPFSLEKLRILIGGVAVFSGGRGCTEVMLTKARGRLRAREVPVRIIVGSGPGHATIYSTDLSRRYVAINAHYD